jgi:DNA-binding GntR family transcriptional regulator
MVKSRTQLSSNGEDVESLAKQAYIALRDRIVSLDLAPGALLSETTLGDSMGISRTPIREALKQLERDYLIAIMPRRGIIVTDVDLHDQLLLLDIRRGIESALFARAAERSSAEQRKRFRELAAALAETAARNDLAAHYAIDREFDGLIDTCANNRFMTDMLRPVHSLTWRFWNMNRGTDMAKKVLDLHVAVAKSVASGDPQRVRGATAAMFDFNEVCIRRQLG